MALTKPAIGSLRNHVTFYKVENGVRTEDKPMYASIMPNSTLLWQRSNKTLTHLITCRFDHYLQDFHLIENTSTMPDGTVRTDTYKIIRMAETHPNEFFEIAVTKL